MFIPGLNKAGGFTITSTPQDADFESSKSSHIELAIQKSLKSPPAAWLWRPTNEIIGKILQVRVGGSFVWPHPGVDTKQVKRLVLVAGGVGIK